MLPLGGLALGGLLQGGLLQGGLLEVPGGLDLTVLGDWRHSASLRLGPPLRPVQGWPPLGSRGPGLLRGGVLRGGLGREGLGRGGLGDRVLASGPDSDLRQDRDRPRPKDWPLG